MPPYPSTIRSVALRKLRSGRRPAVVSRALGVPPTTLKAWLRSADLARAGRRHSRDEVIARATTEYRALRRLMSRLSAAEWGRRLPFAATVRDAWTVKDAIAHVANWKSDVARIARGERRSEAERRAMGSDANHWVFVRYRDLAPRDVIALHRRAQRDLIAALRTAPDSWFASEKPSSWWPADVDRHSAQHRRDVGRAVS